MDKGARVRFTPLAARVEMIRGTAALPAETVEQMQKVRMVILRAAAELEEIIYDAPAYDKGRAMATMDALQQAKNIACDALTVPHQKI